MERTSSTIYYTNEEIVSLDAALLNLGTNRPPLQPANLTPEDEATNVTLMPVLKASAFIDPDTGDTHGSSQWQMRLLNGSYDQPTAE